MIATFWEAEVGRAYVIQVPPGKFGKTIGFPSQYLKAKWSIAEALASNFSIRKEKQEVCEDLMSPGLNPLVFQGHHLEDRVVLQPIGGCMEERRDGGLAALSH